MVSDTVYQLSIPILQDDSIHEDDKSEKLEELLGKELSLSGKQLEDAVLGVLWRHKDSAAPASPPPSRHKIIRSTSPAPWQLRRTTTPNASSPRSTGVSPIPPSGFSIVPAALVRAKSSTASPFTSPRPSPRLAVATPQIPHSPRLSSYEFSDEGPNTETYGDYGSDIVDGLMGEDSASVASSFDGIAWNTGAAEFIPATNEQMSGYEILRSIAGGDRSDQELEALLEANGYDIAATVSALTDAQDPTVHPQSTIHEPNRGTFLVGKSLASNVRPATPSGQQRTSVVCKFFAAGGTCARADCRFSHDLSGHLCKHWLAGNCLAGETCAFSHDMSTTMQQLALNRSATPPVLNHMHANFQPNDYDAFPSLSQSGGWAEFQPAQSFDNMYPNSSSSSFTTGSPNLNALAAFLPGGFVNPMRPHSRGTSSRPSSRQTSNTSPLAIDDESFPSLGTGLKATKHRHHGKRGGHGTHRDTNLAISAPPSSLAEIVKMSASPVPDQFSNSIGTGAQGKMVRTAKSGGIRGIGSNAEASKRIPPPLHVPWLETGDAANKAYLKARAEAFRHGGLRNKFLQSAAQAFNRKDARAAKQLSLRGQRENDLMREAHREAARLLYEERNRNLSGNQEIYVDLHGLHPEEAVSYLENCLQEYRNSERPVYAITGTGHHSKNGKDKVGKAVRAFLNVWRYAYREFSVPGDRNNVGGILGIDARSFDRGVKPGEIVTSETEGDHVGHDDEQDDELPGRAEREDKIRALREEDIPTRSKAKS